MENDNTVVCSASADYILRTSLDIGQGILRSGGEIRRVENTIEIICRSLGAVHAEVFTITNLIIASVRLANGDYASQERRVSSVAYDLHRLNLYNELSRKLCAYEITLDEAQDEIKKIKRSDAYPAWLSYIAAAFAAGGFVLFFGGSLPDAIVSSVIGVAMTYLLNICPSYINGMAQAVIIPFLSGILAEISVKYVFGDSVDKIMIGVVMLLIPGLNIGIAIRDMLSGDTITGIMRFMESILKAALMAVGFAGAVYLVGGLL